MADILEDIMVLQNDAECAAAALKTLERYVARAKKSVLNMPDSRGNIEITVSVEWLAWMIAFFEGEEDGPEF